MAADDAGGGPNPIDVRVGRRLKERRARIGMSQERLGELLGVTYQQVQKYERGANRIGSSRLYELCRALDVPPAYFLDDPAEAASAAPEPASPPGLAEGPPAGFVLDGAPAETPRAAAPAETEGREATEMLRAFGRIRDPVVRRRLLDLARALGGNA